MRTDELCGLCDVTLEVACEDFGGRFCELKERYYSDPQMAPDDVALEITKMCSPDQIAHIRERVMGSVGA